MGWVKISDDWYDNDKIDTVGPLGAALHHAAIAFCNRNLTDGYIRKGKLRNLLNFDGISVTTTDLEQFPVASAGDDAARLVIGWMLRENLIHEAGHDCESCHDREDGGKPSAVDYLVHDYFTYQPSREQIEAKAEANRKRVEAWRESRKQGGNGVGNAVGNGVTEDVRNAPCNAPGNAGVQTPQPQPQPQPQVTTDVVTCTPTGGAGGALEVVPTPEATDKPSRRKKGTRIPSPDWMPQPKTVDQVKADFPGVTAEQLRHEHNLFIDWATGSASRNAVKLDWDATWRGWMRRELAKTPPTRNGHNGTRSTTDEKALGWLQLGADLDTRMTPQTSLALEAYL